MNKLDMDRPDSAPRRLRSSRFLAHAWILALPALLLGTPLDADPPPDVSQIYGRIQFVESFPDYKVKVVEHFADLHVQTVSAFPDRPGRWQMVESFPDYKGPSE